MSSTVGDPSEAVRRLAEIGIAAEVESAGQHGEVALVRVADRDIEALVTDLRAEIVSACLAAGFRHATLHLAGP